MEKKKKAGSKKKLILIISIVTLLAIAIAAILIFVVFKPVEPEIVLSDTDILSANAWEKQDSPTVIWTFHEDGTGEITTNKVNYYDMTWAIKDSPTNILTIRTDWLYELEDSFSFELNREENYFTVKNLADETVSIFVPLGTSDKRIVEPSDEQPEDVPEADSPELEKAE